MSTDAIRKELTEGLERFAFQVSKVNHKDFTSDVHSVKFKGHPSIDWITEVISDQVDRCLLAELEDIYEWSTADIPDELDRRIRELRQSLAFRGATHE